MYLLPHFKKPFLKRGPWKTDGVLEYFWNNDSSYEVVKVKHEVLFPQKMRASQKHLTHYFF